MFHVAAETERRTEGRVDGRTDVIKQRIAFPCFMTAPMNESICCERSVTDNFVLDNKMLEQVIDFF